MQKEIVHLLKQLVSLQERLLQCAQAQGQTTHDEQWLDGADVKQLLHISDSTLYRLVKQHKLSFKQVGKKRYYLKAALFKDEGGG